MYQTADSVVARYYQPIYPSIGSDCSSGRGRTNILIKLHRFFLWKYQLWACCVTFNILKLRFILKFKFLLFYLRVSQIGNVILEDRCCPPNPNLPGLWTQSWVTENIPTYAKLSCTCTSKRGSCKIQKFASALIHQSDGAGFLHHPLGHPLLHTWPPKYPPLKYGVLGKWTGYYQSNSGRRNTTLFQCATHLLLRLYFKLELRKSFFENEQL
jgi:hypothetical protein